MGVEFRIHYELFDGESWQKRTEYLTDNTKFFFKLLEYMRNNRMFCDVRRMRINGVPVCDIDIFNLESKKRAEYVRTLLLNK